jgi:hypothetical protein
MPLRKGGSSTGGEETLEYIHLHPSQSADRENPKVVLFPALPDNKFNRIPN